MSDMDICIWTCAARREPCAVHRAQGSMRARGRGMGKASARGEERAGPRGARDVNAKLHERPYVSIPHIHCRSLDGGRRVSLKLAGEII